MSHITTHILDTTKGIPAAGIATTLFAQEQDWVEIARGITNTDGRIVDLLPSGEVLPAGVYKIRFHTKTYFELQSSETFYPFVEIVFSITSAVHLHIPLLISPFGYTTYRGS